MSPGHIAYKAWRERLTFQHSAPHWEDLPKIARVKWEEIADAVLATVAEVTPSHSQGAPPVFTFTDGSQRYGPYSQPQKENAMSNREPIKPWVIDDGVDGLLKKIREHSTEFFLGLNQELNARRALNLFQLLDNHLTDKGRRPTPWE